MLLVNPLTAAQEPPRLTIDTPCDLDDSPEGVSAFRRADWGGRVQNGRFSGSSQFCPRGLSTLQRRLPPGPLCIVDLRQESHGMVGDTAVGYWQGNNAGNPGCSVSDIIADENARLAAIDRLPRGCVLDAFEVGSKHHGVRSLFPSTLRSDHARTEAQLVEDAQTEQTAPMTDVRIPVQDEALKPPDAMVDLFVRTMRGLPETTWVHFHCLHGHGRTTLFMAMYDILRNGQRDHLHTIIARQYDLGGVDLTRSATTHAFLKSFRHYVKDTAHHAHPVAWSAWHNHQSVSVPGSGTWMGMVWGLFWGRSLTSPHPIK